MTCIAGIQHKKTVWIGGDSAGTSGDLQQRVLGDKKVFARGEFIFGVCGLPKVMDALHFAFDIPEHEKGMEDRKYVISTFLPAMKVALAKAGCASNEEFEGAILMGHRGCLYRLEGNFQLITNSYGFDAVGSGSDIAVGSLHATDKKFLNNPKRRITTALEASAINNAAVRPPFYIINVRNGASV